MIRDLTVPGASILYKQNRDRSTLLSFSRVDKNFHLFPIDNPVVPKPQVCQITGLLAKYIDPKTKQPFANVEAFRAIRHKS